MKKIFFKIYQSSLVKNALKAMQFLVYQLGLDSLLAKNGEKKWAFFLLPTHKFYEKHAPIRWQRNGIAYELDRKDYHQWQIFA
ncbi:MAG: hypothetical protein K2Q22_05715, partial [Cytophagales bacterium]|nr:hypothetical protein [Cytophagales bacterium]